MSANLDVAILRTFTLIAQGCTFVEAAEAVGRSQSTVSLQIQRLEADLGTPLFRRTRQGIALTMAGERFLGHAQRLVQMNDDALVQMSGGAPNSISFGVTPDFAETVLPDVLDRFHRECPAADVTLRIDGTRPLIEAVGRHEIDLAIGLNLEHGLNQGLIAEAPMIWIGRHGFEWRAGAALPLALFEGPCAFRNAAFAALGHTVAYRIAATSASLGGLLAAVRSGLCVTVRTPHLLQPGLVDLGQALNLPALPRVAFGFYAGLGGRSRARDTLVEICKQHFSILKAMPPAL